MSDSKMEGPYALNLKHYILLVAKYTGLFALSRRLTARKVRILAYHGIWLGDGHFGNFLYMNHPTFARRMSLLRQWRYPVVSLDALTNNAEQLPDSATILTIDDGWYGTYKHMLPALEAQGFPATVYLTTYYCLNNSPIANVALRYCFERLNNQSPRTLHLPAWQFGPIPLITLQDRESGLKLSLEKLASLANDSERQAFMIDVAEAIGTDTERLLEERWFHLMNAEEVKDAAQRGITFELHTHRHRISDGGVSCLSDEIQINRDLIRELTERDPVHFCYPSGIYSQDIWPELRECNILSATTTEVGLVDHNSEVYELPRILDGQYVSELEFEAELSGFLELIRRARK